MHLYIVKVPFLGDALIKGTTRLRFRFEGNYPSI